MNSLGIIGEGRFSDKSILDFVLAGIPDFGFRGRHKKKI